MQLRRQKKLNKRIVRAALLVMLGPALLFGCAEEQKAPPTPPPPKQQVAPVQQQKPPAPKEEEKPQPVYSYNPAGRRDPFTPLIVRDEKKTRTGIRPPLERYTITEFKLSGIFWGGFGYNAIFEAPDGKGYFVRVGTVVGPNQGVVKKITQNSILIVETYKTGTGETQRKQIIVEFRKKQEGTP